MSKKLKEYRVNNFKFIGSLFLFYVVYFLLFSLVGIELRRQGYSMAVVDMVFYTGFALISLGCILVSIERKKD